MGYNFFQAINYTALTAFEFEIVGPGNPLARVDPDGAIDRRPECADSYMTRVEKPGHFTAART